MPVVTQIANHLARFGSFKSSDLIFVYAGSNDVFTQFSTFATTAAQVQADAAAGKITADQANLALFAAQQSRRRRDEAWPPRSSSPTSQTQILAKGGTYVAVMTLSDIADTPFGNSLPATAQPVLTDLSQVFNLWLRDGLTGQPVQIIDTFAIFKDGYQNPAQVRLRQQHGAGLRPGQDQRDHPRRPSPTALRCSATRRQARPTTACAPAPT